MFAVRWCNHSCFYMPDLIMPPLRSFFRPPATPLDIRMNGTSTNLTNEQWSKIPHDFSFLGGKNGSSWNDIPWTNSMFPILVIKNPSDIPWNTGRFMTWSFFHGLLSIIIPTNWVVQAPYIANQPGFLDRCLNWFPKNDGRRKNVSQASHKIDPDSKLRG